MSAIDPEIIASTARIERAINQNNTGALAYQEPHFERNESVPAAVDVCVVSSSPPTSSVSRSKADEAAVKRADKG